MEPVPLQFADLVSLDEVGPELSDDSFAKFVADAELAGAAGRNGHQLVANFHVEAAVIDREHREIYRRIAKAATKETTNDSRLEKRSSENTARTELSENGKWVYKFNQAGELISGREVEP